MRRIRLRVAYDGTAYCGWQVQPEVPTIEGELNQAISRLTKEEIIVIGASRTDAGVHAKGNVAVFDTESTIPADRFAYALNPLLPEDIVVVASDDVAADWHPRHCDTEKTYEYKILNSKFPDPMRRRDTYHVSFDLDLEKMREAAGYLKGEHDFKSFCNVHTQVEDTVRTIYDLEVEKEEELITIRVRGNGFLYNMVRILFLPQTSRLSWMHKFSIQLYKTPAAQHLCPSAYNNACYALHTPYHKPPDNHPSAAS